MELMILMVITFFFALVGLVDFVVGAGRWMHRTGRLDSAVLVLEVSEEENAAEVMLMQAADITVRNNEVHGIGMVVVCKEGSENEKICRHFCEDREIPIVSRWSEIGGVFNR